MMKRFVCIFPELYNVSLKKDIGMIPCWLAREHGYESWLVGYQRDGAYPYAATMGIRLHFVADRSGSARDFVDFLQAEAAGIDVLQVYGLHNHFNVYLIRLYRQLHPQGKVYVKLDAGENIEELAVEDEILYLLSTCTLVSAESEEVCRWLNRHWPFPVACIPNGTDFPSAERSVVYVEKQDVILTVGRLGTKQKATEVLLEAFRLAAPRLPGWRLRLAGPLTPEFSPYVEGYFARYPELRGRVEFIGELVDPDDLAQEYRRAKIFCLPSCWEGFALVGPEAGRYGCALVMTDLACMRDVTAQGRFGALVPLGDAVALADSLAELGQDERRLTAICQELPRYVREHFQWRRIVECIAAGLDRGTAATGRVLGDALDLGLQRVYGQLLRGQLELAAAEIRRLLLAWPEPEVWRDRDVVAAIFCRYGVKIHSCGLPVASDVVQEAIQALLCQILPQGADVPFLQYLAENWRWLGPAGAEKNRLQRCTAGLLLHGAEILEQQQQWRGAADCLTKAVQLGVVLDENGRLHVAKLYARAGMPGKAAEMERDL